MRCTSPFGDQVVWKITGECNLRCTYCHFFADPKVDQYPVRSAVSTTEKVLERLNEYVRSLGLRTLRIHLEGGEPLVLGKRRFEALCESFLKLAREASCNFPLSITTNATLLDEEWVGLLKRYAVALTISVDGPSKQFNHRRIYISGRSSYDRTKRGIATAKAGGLNVACLVVADPRTEPRDLFDGMDAEFGLKEFDVLIPKINYDDKENGLYQPIGNYFERLFELWYREYSERGFRVRFCTDLVRLLTARTNRARVIKGSSNSILLIESNGDLQPIYNLGYRLRSADTVTPGQPNVHTHTLLDVLRSDDWSTLERAISAIPEDCTKCDWLHQCGGGIPYTRFSSNNGLANPTLYCADFKQIFRSAAKLVLEDVVDPCGIDGR